MCNPPGYACGYWVHAGSEHGFLVCPAGNSECGPGVSTWTESWEHIDGDLEASIDAVGAAYPGEIDRDQGSVLTGFSLGASVAPLIAEKHPGRWPYLVLVEATAPLDAAKLRAAGVRAVALVAGELGANVYSQKAQCDALTKAGLPTRCWIMPKVGHWYSANIDEIMGDAIDWMLAQGS
jgi:pimeloyl-ACP methyl ester carboxylesterase